MICMSRRSRRISPRLAASRSRPSKGWSRRGLDQPQDQSAERALAGAGFADQPQRLAGVNLERNIVDGAHFSARFAAEGGVAMGKILVRLRISIRGTVR